MPGFEHDVLNLEREITRWQREAVDRVRARLAAEQKGELFHDLPRQEQAR